GLSRFLNTHLWRHISLTRAIYIIRAKFKNFFSIGNYHNEAWEYYRARIPYVQQQFVPNLKCDYKALVFMDKVFLLKRGTRKDDFRASGSGIFSFPEPSVELLNFALQCR